MLHVMRESHREMHGSPGMPPGSGNDATGGVPDLELSPLPDPGRANADVDLFEMAQKFEQTFAELTPPEEIRPTRRDEFQFLDDVAETSKPAAPALPLYTRGVRREPVLTQPRPRYDVASEARQSAEKHLQAPPRVRARWASTVPFFWSAVALALGVGMGFLAAKRVPSSATVSSIATPTGSGALRLDYELKQPPSPPQRRKPKP